MRHVMAHLTNIDLVDATEPEVPPRVAAHLAECDRCRRRVADLSATRLLAGDVDEPEPSPLFWPLFAARVSAAVRDDAGNHDRRWWAVPAPRWKWAAAAGAAALLIVSAAVALQRAPGTPAAPVQVAADRPVNPGGGAEPADAEPGLAGGDGTWPLVADAGEDVDWDVASAAGLGPAPGSAEGAVEDLSEAERRELARLLERALAGEPL